MRSNVLWLVAGVVLCAFLVFGYNMYQRMVYGVDGSLLDLRISQSVNTVDELIDSINAHRPEVITRVEVIQREAGQRVFALGADELASVAIARAEAMRSRLAASSDIESAARVDGE